VVFGVNAGIFLFGTTIMNLTWLNMGFDLGKLSRYFLIGTLSLQTKRNMDRIGIELMAKLMLAVI